MRIERTRTSDVHFPTPPNISGFRAYMAISHWRDSVHECVRCALNSQKHLSQNRIRAAYLAMIAIRQEVALFRLVPADLPVPLCIELVLL